MEHAGGRSLRIVISGACGSGKSTVARLVERTLAKHGFKVSLADPDRGFQDSWTEEQRRKATEAVASRGPVTVETVQTMRSEPPVSSALEGILRTTPTNELCRAIDRVRQQRDWEASRDLEEAARVLSMELQARMGKVEEDL